MSHSMSIDLDRGDDSNSADSAAQSGGIYAQVRYGIDEDERSQSVPATRPPDEEDEELYDDDDMDEEDYDDDEEDADLDGALLEEGIPFYLSETDEGFVYEVGDDDMDDDDDDDFIVEEEEEEHDDDEDEEDEYSDDSDGEYGQRVYLSFMTTNGRRSGKSRLS
ncbi:hypothetical protein V1519DRAFT_367216, partial [Lipomyces tetrasporus]